MPILAGKKQLAIHFFPHRLRLFHLSTEKVRAQSVRNGHQSAYFRADTMNRKLNFSKIRKKLINRLIT